jgi:hypothetical protein
VTPIDTVSHTVDGLEGSAEILVDRCWNVGLAPPSAVEEIWKQDFDSALANCPGGVYDLTMHPQVIGRGHRMLMIERLIDYSEGREGLVFETLGEYVGQWKADNPLEKWKAANPLYAGDTADPRSPAGQSKGLGGGSRRVDRRR